MSSIYAALEDRDTLEPTESDWDPARQFFEERKVRPTEAGSSASGSTVTNTWHGWDAERDSSRVEGIVQWQEEGAEKKTHHDNIILALDY